MKAREDAVWCGRGARRIAATAEGVPCVVVGWDKRRRTVRVEFATGNRRSFRPDAVEVAA